MAKNKIAPPTVALITGAARRVGAEIAQVLHENGINVVLHYHKSKKEASALCQFFNERRSNSAMIVQANLSQIKKLPVMIQHVMKQWGRLDILVNNASTFYQTPTGKVTETVWDHLLDVNLKAPFFLAQSAMPYLKKQRGCIINIVDIYAKRPLSGYPVYSISKAGLSMMTKALAKEAGPLVRVNSVSPGSVLWPEGSNRLTASIKQKIISRTALKCEGEAKDIANAVLFLVRDARFITGQDITVDGGRSLFL